MLEEIRRDKEYREEALMRLELLSLAGTSMYVVRVSKYLADPPKSSVKVCTYTSSGILVYIVGHNFR